ncbi:putative nuclease HARBI1 [Haliotis rubra]|uniref:putative nuclease HARBI1 n=1 Tax=Haliotis rubra TaxID=36100 RepID=UPI001EE4EDB1|nr:putative nuclease HARBI1 [Haliotis rubra]
MERTHTSISDGFILGDNGYPCRPFLLTPYLNPQGRRQQRYNDSLCATRVTIERTFGRWKRRFHVLHSEVRMTPSRVCRIVVACAVLHNIAISMGEPQDERANRGRPTTHRCPRRDDMTAKAYVIMWLPHSFDTNI